MDYNFNEIRELDYLRLKNEFLKIRDEKFEYDSYYELILKVNNYDGFYTYSNIEFEKLIKRLYPTTRGLFGMKYGIQFFPLVVSVYAKKDETGIHEMITGKEVTVYGENGDLYCYGLKKYNGSLIKIARELKIINNGKLTSEDLQDYLHRDNLTFINQIKNRNLKEQYIKKLQSLSSNAYYDCKRCQQEIEKEKQNENSAADYLKTYKMPRK